MSIFLFNFDRNASAAHHLQNPINMLSLLSRALYVAVILALPALCLSQPQSDTAHPFVVKEIVQWEFHSQTIGEDYTIYIHFPPGYDTTTTRYPALYMTDGDWNMTVAMNCFNMLRQDYQTIEPLIVGIGYGNRTNKRARDLNPSEGAPKFLSFIEKEVMPFVEARYRVNSDKALYGYSFGGMFTTYALFEHPGSFQTIFIGAPGNSGSELLPSAKKYFATHSDLRAKIFLGVGSFEQQTAANIDSFKTYMLGRHISGLDIATAITPNAGHGAALAQVMQNAMAFAYCKKHRPIALPAKTLESYTGTYSLAADPKIRFQLSVEQGHLYFHEGTNPPLELVHCGADAFFVRENEKADITFRRDGGKQYILYSFPGETPTRLNKVD